MNGGQSGFSRERGAGQGGGLAAALRRPFDALEAARGHLLPFAAMALGLGIGLWFVLPFEPSRAQYLGAAGPG